jgi:hypothetical protein
MEKEIMNTPVFQYVLSMGGYIALLIAIVATMRKYYRFASWFWVAALLTFPLWLNSVDGWFRWAKTLSVLLPTILVGFARVSSYEKRTGKFWEFIQKDWVMWFLYAVLFLNIMEATIKDFTMGNIYNGMAGFLLCVTIPFPMKFWKIGTEKHGDLIVFTTAAWNFLYTTWNGCFVFAETGAFFASSICILVAADLYAMIKRRPELYVTARVYTLATHILLRATVPQIFPALMDATTWHNPVVLKYWGIANLIIMVPYVFWYLWQLHTGKAETSFRRGQVQKAVELNAAD